ncbi:rhamnosyl/mannosyltransferase [Halarchaeum solikamskense]|uniref:glycosyltransferase n=1 Tax=Halarchaeum nitratireducens TaxID=489913 RepID=UPI001B3ACF26|nr:glycosyltransferase [Halarchaeum solikamskense]MBP2249911.1 rhamnosyl/mannosyltransferase [Halarchaeum solikamskense]
MAADNDHPRVLHVCKHYHPATGGIENVVRSLVTGVDDATFRVLTARDGRGRSRVDTVDGTRVVRAGSLGSALSTPLAPAFPRHLRRERRWADVVHYHLPFPLGPVSALLDPGGETPSVVTFHDDIVGKGPAVYPYAPVLGRFLDAADRLLVTSPNMRDECARVAPYRGKTDVIPLGIETGDVPREGRRPDGRELLFVGRLVPFKGVRHLVAAMTHLDDATLTVVGAGPEREGLEARAAACGVADRVTFAGYVSEERLERQYREADVFVLPSVGANESFGIVQLEAMAHGLPVVNTALPTGVPYVSVDGETGYTVDPGDPAAIADAAARLLADPERYERFSANARERVHGTFARRGMLDATAAVYRSLADGRDGE